MNPIQIPEEELAEGCANLQPFVPKYLVTAVRLPTGAIELTTNTDNIETKIDYILEAYNQDMCLKTNVEVQILNMMII